MNESVNDSLEGRVRNLEILLTEVKTMQQAEAEAVRLQAKEYERRLHDLNGEYKRDRERQADYVTIDKYEDKIAAMDEARITAVQAEKDAREAALFRVDEKFDDYVKKWEQIQAEQASKLITLTAAAAEAKRIAEDQGRQTREEADRAARDQKESAETAQRKTTKNIAIVGIVLAAFVGVANLLPGLLS